MSESIEKKAAKKRKISMRHRMALVEIIERLRHTDRPDYKSVSLRTGVGIHYLKQLVHEWRQGNIDLGDPQTPEEKAIDARMQHEQALLLSRRYKALLLNDFEASLLIAEDLMTNGKKGTKGRAWEAAGIPQIVQELRRVQDLQERFEKGYNTVLDDYHARQNPIKDANPAVQVIETKIIAANEEERAMRALEAPKNAPQ